MSVYSHTWRDEAKQRDIELVVDYSLDHQTVYISRITPVGVTFLDPASGNPIRSIQVSTPTARRMLVDAYQQRSEPIPSLEQLILSRELLAPSKSPAAR